MRRILFAFSCVVLLFAVAILMMSFPSREMGESRPLAFTNTTRPESRTAIPAGVLTVTPPNGLTSTGTAGGPFNPASIVYTLQNTGGAPINWTAAKTQPWITLSAAGGKLRQAATVTITVSINSNANSLATNTYTDTVTFTNTTNGSGNTTRPVALTVTGRAIQPDAEEQTMINLINAYRQQGDTFDPPVYPPVPANTLAPWAYSPQCQAAADWMANDLATRVPSVFSHIDSLGRDMVARAKAFGIISPGELLGSGATTSSQMLTMWQKSNDHKKILLSSFWKTVGAAKATGPNGVFWVVNIGT